MSEWQPIETYSGDERVVLVSEYDGKVYPAIYQEWLGKWTHITESSIDYAPTHWRPLPEPPQKETEK